MPLDYTHQLTLLRDILQDHHTDCKGTPQECAQLERLATRLMQHGSLNNEIKDVLGLINTYSHDGSTHENLEEHITNHKPHIENWLNTIQPIQIS
ncbi:YtzH-like family protein [Fictibacillus sp. KIGAM418]|uniref:YtzH-like family protein n=1 Tax=Fictibacillus marinisediminis TaxID=2878389 RepID=A0A9X2BDY5_9BACL|nr:YtzH-like family protein [Fictibacillus marinisediminis]MCK6258101.1 YtzH-like family protein [Fictibacillus marinisediminis]